MVGEEAINDLLEKSFADLKADMASLANTDFNHTYSNDKWTIKTLIRHCIDAEIIFLSRALCIARNDPNPIRSFNENDYANESMADYNEKDLIEGFLNARYNTILLYKSFKEEWLKSRKGKTDKGDSLSLLSIAYIIIGHWLHHKKVLTEKYGIKF